MNQFNMSDEDLKAWIFRINELFYEKVYKHPWLKDVFKIIDQQVITKQQTDFMLQVLGGPKMYGGRWPTDAHHHIYIDEEMWQLREELLLEAFRELQAPPLLQEKWLKIDEGFKKAIVMKDPSECCPRYKNDEIIVVPNPLKKVA